METKFEITVMVMVMMMVMMTMARPCCRRRTPFALTFLGTNNLHPMHVMRGENDFVADWTESRSGTRSGV